MPEHELGRYTGRLALEPLPDGRRMRVLEDFGFMEADGLHWSVPPRSIVDGASIPRPLWPLIGGPFEGKHRTASVVHDYYCAVRSADWKSVHRVFYRGMLVSGVSVHQAKVMYAAVYFAGPRWDDMVEQNVCLGPPAIPTRYPDPNVMFSIKNDPAALVAAEFIKREGMSAFDWVASGRVIADASSEVVLQLQKISELVERDDPSLRLLETSIDGALRLLPDSNGASREISIGQLKNLD